MAGQRSFEINRSLNAKYDKINDVKLYLNVDLVSKWLSASYFVVPGGQRSNKEMKNCIQRWNKIKMCKVWDFLLFSDYGTGKTI